MQGDDLAKAALSKKDTGVQFEELLQWVETASQKKYAWLNKASSSEYWNDYLNLEEQPKR
jgi:hypothetical protein